MRTSVTRSEKFSRQVHCWIMEATAMISFCLAAARLLPPNRDLGPVHTGVISISPDRLQQSSTTTDIMLFNSFHGTWQMNSLPRT